MDSSDVAFMLEAIDHHWAFKFRSTKLGVDFWLVSDVRRVPEGQIGFTAEEFIQLSKLPDPTDLIKAKAAFAGSKLRDTVVERVTPKQGALW